MPLITTCKQCKTSFEIRDEDLKFYEKISVPAPTLCPPCREQRRFSFRNERNLYRRTCGLCKKSIISIYSPDKQIPVYCQKCWWGDSWDAGSFGRDFDSGKPFFEQFHRLLKAVPRCALYNINPINSEYCQQVVDNKDCYLCFVMKNCESCMYISHALGDKDCIDSNYLHRSELCCECLDSHHLYNCIFCEHCMNSSDLCFCYDLNNCQNCFGCTGLRNKQYHVFNKKYSKEEYEKIRGDFKLKDCAEIPKIQAKFAEFKLQFPHRNLWTINVENSIGNNIQNTKNCHHCFDSFELQDCAYCTWVFSGKDYYDCYGMGDSELVYEAIGDEEVNRCAFNTFVTRSSDVFYSDSCFSSSNLFGCAGMKKAKYCILNKQYTPAEYSDLRAKIIERMKKTSPDVRRGGELIEGGAEYGEFFPTALSPFCYNETIAQDYYPV